MLKRARFGKIPSLCYIFVNVNANIADIAQFLSQKSRIRNILTLCDNGCIFIDKRVDPLFIPNECCMCRKLQSTHCTAKRKTSGTCNTRNGASASQHLSRHSGWHRSVPLSYRESSTAMPRAPCARVIFLLDTTTDDVTTTGEVLVTTHLLNNWFCTA